MCGAGCAGGGSRSETPAGAPPRGCAPKPHAAIGAGGDEQRIGARAGRRANEREAALAHIASARAAAADDVAAALERRPQRDRLLRAESGAQGASSLGRRGRARPRAPLRAPPPPRAPPRGGADAAGANLTSTSARGRARPRGRPRALRRPRSARRSRVRTGAPSLQSSACDPRARGSWSASAPSRPPETSSAALADACARAPRAATRAQRRRRAPCERRAPALPSARTDAISSCSPCDEPSARRARVPAPPPGGAHAHVQTLPRRATIWPTRSVIGKTPARGVS